MVTKKRNLVRSTNEAKRYTGSTKGTSKCKWYNHIEDIKNTNKNSTELSKYNWKLKDKNIQYDLSWTIPHIIGEHKNIKEICKNLKFWKSGNRKR